MMFRKEIQQMLKDNFDFYAITAHADVNPESFIKNNFQATLGKVFHPLIIEKGVIKNTFLWHYVSQRRSWNIIETMEDWQRKLINVLLTRMTRFSLS